MRIKQHTFKYALVQNQYTIDLAELVYLKRLHNVVNTTQLLFTIYIVLWTVQ